MRKLRLFLRDVLVALPLGKRLQTYVWQRREAKKRARLEMRCARLRRVGPDLLRKVNKVFQDAGIAYFVDFGSMLGCVREQYFIRHDDDIDYSIPDQGLSMRHLLEVMERAGFRYRHHFEYEGKVWEICFLDGEQNFDVFMLEKSGDLELNCSHYRLYDRAYPSLEAHTCYWSRRRISQTMVMKQFAGVEVPVPENYEEIVEFNYGKDWRTPIPGKNNDGRYLDGIKGEREGFSYVYHDRSRLLAK